MTGLLWVTWRQHRAVVSWTTVLVLVVVLFSPDLIDWAFRNAFGAVVAVFWGAPLVAREFEERTYLVAWGQDVSPARWLAVKCGLLGSAAVVLAALLDVRQIGFTLFGFALGVVAGFVTRRTVPAIAFTLVGYVLVRWLFAGETSVWLFESSVLCGVFGAVLIPVAFVLLSWRTNAFRMGVA
ncbi:hypothetical protein FKR81_28950 [Lentzea tibetensis]|uniref:Uncharacterized protein n=1 Tax=Lentzea tibetensis TaxID=2591470 RepID=A0A563EMB5_9PSEU|nr:hypothetical protein [Lentzea tibetensis]TWP48318.1 hypothetical protein FKR81_28950 [Lentzea tibetensis]